MNKIKNLLCNRAENDQEDFPEYFKFFAEFYNIEGNLPLLGDGAFGTVFKVKHSIDEGEFALKILEINRKKHGEREAAREIKCLRELDHPNIVRYYFAFKIVKLPSLNKWPRPEHFPSETPLFCIQTELCHTNLRVKLYEKRGTTNAEKLSVEFNRFARQICDAVKYFHQCNIMHRDLNPNNIFLKRDIYGLLNVKIGDFGLSRLYNAEGEPITTGLFGVSYYICIEMNEKIQYGLKCDVYSVGVILYEMFHPELMIPPSSDPSLVIHESMNVLKSVHQEKDPVKALFGENTSFVPQMENLLIGMIQREEKRLTAEQVVSSLNTILPL